MDLIVAVDENWAIGYQGDLLTRISADLKNFKALTTGAVIILGRKTIETFPGGRALPGRENIILSRDSSYCREDAVVCRSVEEVLSKVENMEKEVFVVGGESVYRQFLPYCHKAYVTKIKRAFPADSYFENLDENREWEIAEAAKIMEEDGMPFQFMIYRRKRLKYPEYLQEIK